MSYSLKHTFVSSDHHFGSWKNSLIKIFSKDEEDDLILKWNSIVKPNDIVLYNGDFHDCGVLELEQYAKRLNGHINLIKGNHETLPIDVYNALFDSVVDEIFMPELNLVMHHMPTDTGYNQIYGHLHHGELSNPLDKQHNFCSCVQSNDGYPVSLEHILLSFK